MSDSQNQQINECKCSSNKDFKALKKDFAEVKSEMEQLRKEIVILRKAVRK